MRSLPSIGKAVFGCVELVRDRLQWKARPSSAPGNIHLGSASTWRDQFRRLVFFAWAVQRHAVELRTVLAVASIVSEPERDDERRARRRNCSAASPFSSGRIRQGVPTTQPPTCHAVRWAIAVLPIAIPTSVPAQGGAVTQSVLPPVSQNQTVRQSNSPSTCAAWLIRGDKSKLSEEIESPALEAHSIPPRAQSSCSLRWALQGTFEGELDAARRSLCRRAICPMSIPATSTNAT